MNIRELRSICVGMQSRGVAVAGNICGRRGGAGPAEGQTVVIEGHYLNVPVSSWYVKSSPYRIVSSENGYVLYDGDNRLCAVDFPPEPAFYLLTTPTGIPLKKVALIHGKDCLASTLYQKCLYWSTPSRCRFCAIELSLHNGRTIHKKAPADVAVAAEKGCMLDGIKHVTLTSGVYLSGQGTEEHLCNCIREIKGKVPVAVHVQVCPAGNPITLIDKLNVAGADTIGIHAESCSIQVLKNIAPFKAEIGFDTYRQWWAHAVGVFGKNQVSSFLIAGLGEETMQMNDFAESLCSMGVFPYILPLRPIPGSDFENRIPPDPDTMIRLYETAAENLKKYRLSSALSKAGCVRCGACSGIRLFE